MKSRVEHQLKLLLYPINSWKKKKKKVVPGGTVDFGAQQPAQKVDLDPSD